MGIVYLGAVYLGAVYLCTWGRVPGCCVPVYLGAVYLGAVYLCAVYLGAVYLGALYLGALYLGAMYLGAVYLGAVYLGAVYLGAVYLGAVYLCTWVLCTWLLCTWMCSRCCEDAAVLGHELQELRDDAKRAACGAGESGQSELQVQGAAVPWADWACRLATLSSQTSLLAADLSPATAANLLAQPAHLELQWQQLAVSGTRPYGPAILTSSSWVKGAESGVGAEAGDKPRQQQRLLFISRCKRLQEWLTEAEERIALTTGPTLEETIDTLQKACVGELGQRAWRRSSVERLGAVLRESEAGTAANVDDKLRIINNRWQHLGHLAQNRVKRLQQTLSSVQSLGGEMNGLRSWLAHMESELSKPLVYSICDDQEIERKLAEQQELQQEIEQRSAGVASVLRLCDGLLEEGEVEAECDGLQQGSRSLQRRWRNVCSMAVERRMRIEETWRLWQKFLEDYSQFEEWLRGAEEAVTNPLTSQVPYALAREELKKYEALQRGAQESLTQLELINKQYRRLAREHRTDTASRLRRTLAAANQRSDRLQSRTTAILRRLKHLTGQREEFTSGRAAVLVWLTELDLQLTNVEHFSQSHVTDKVRQLQAFQQEITLNTNKIDQLIVAGERLIQKIEPLDAVEIEEELEELHAYCQGVFSRVDRFHQRLVCNPLVTDMDADTDTERSPRVPEGGRGALS
ncbi:nesprin-2 [Rhinoraja longicauda]